MPRKSPFSLTKCPVAARRRRAGSVAKGGEQSTAARFPVKQEMIFARLRDEIVKGTLRPGERVASQIDLARRFKVSGVTVQLALHRLRCEGFIECRRRSGTFVADKPPHLHRYALVFWNDPTSRLAFMQWSKYYAALTSEAARLQQEGRQILTFYGIDERSDSEARRQLQRYVGGQQLAGVIFANQPFVIEGAAILEQPGIPRVALASDSPYPWVNVLAFDREMWMDKALAYLAERRRKRVAILSIVRDAGQSWLYKPCERRGLTVPEYWRQSVPWKDPYAARNCAHLLAKGIGAERPDGLLITDDNLVEPAIAGLIAAGVRVPEDIEVVAHCNFPWPPACALPAQKIGFDIRQTLLSAMELIDRQRRGEKVPHLSKVPAVFEEEVDRH